MKDTWAIALTVLVGAFLALLITWALVEWWT